MAGFHNLATRCAITVGVGGALATALLIVLHYVDARRVQRRHVTKQHVVASIDEVLDSSASDFAARVVVLLRSQGFARLKLAHAAASLTHQLFEDSNTFFDDPKATRGAHIPPKQRTANDSRNGYVWERGREFLELHPCISSNRASASGSTAVLLHTAMSFCESCHLICKGVLEEMATTCHPLAMVLEAEKTAVAASGERSAGSSSDPPLFPPAGGSTFSASMLRVHRYTEDADYPPHADLGLLTIAPRASVPGLMVQVQSTGEWLPIEERMEEDEVILFAGSTLTELSGLPALLHKVVRQGCMRISAPYFFRSSPEVMLPETVGACSDRGTCQVNQGQQPQLSVKAFVLQKIEERRVSRARTLPEVEQPALATVATACAPPVTATQSTWSGTLTTATPVHLEGAPLGVAATASQIASDATLGGVPVATPVSLGASLVAVAMATPIASPAPKGAVPARVRHLFSKLDADKDGRVTRSELTTGLAKEFGAGLPLHATEAIEAFFQTHAIGDLEFPEHYVDGLRFNTLFAEVLFLRFDAGNSGFLSHTQAQNALKFLMRTPTDGSPKPDIPIACPPGECSESATVGELRVPKQWFGLLYRSMP